MESQYGRRAIERSLLESAMLQKTTGSPEQDIKACHDMMKLNCILEEKCNQ